ncbi:conjugal transfer protein, partial [Enterococcus sp. AZ103]|uniref:conjugal transfer protein n=1 Tax=Enterococcus sp. AZ103 TaxID=2774628 RepID=UPI003F242737
VNNWLKDTFFPKYVETSDKEVVKYMMKNPEVLGGVMTFKNIQEMAAYPMKGGRIDCYVIVTVTDKQLSQDYNNAYHLIIEQDDNDQFVVERLTHDIKN